MKRTEAEQHKINLLYHATVHFEVRKFVHNAKAEELTYDKMIEVTKTHERTCQEYQQHKQAYSAPASGFHKPLIQTNALAKSFQKKSLVASVGGATTKKTAQHTDRPATAVGGRTTGQLCAEQGGTPHLHIHPPHIVNRGKEDHPATSRTSREEVVAKLAASSGKTLLVRRDKEALPRTRTSAQFHSSW